VEELWLLQKADSTLRMVSEVTVVVMSANFHNNFVRVLLEDLEVALIEVWQEKLIESRSCSRVDVECNEKLAVFFSSR